LAEFENSSFLELFHYKTPFVCVACRSFDTLNAGRERAKASHGGMLERLGYCVVFCGFTGPWQF